MKNNNKFKTAVKLTLAASSAIAIVSASAYLAVFRPVLPSSAFEKSDHAERIGNVSLTSYCPAQMTLADDEQYGDSAFIADEGDLKSSGRVIAAGNAASSIFSDISGSKSKFLANNSLGSYDSRKIGILADSWKDSGGIVKTDFSENSDNATVSGALVSYAGQGDLKGLSAASCFQTAVRQNILIPSSAVGYSHQLVIANPSDKSAAVHISAHGTSSSEPLALAVNASVAVAARSERVVNLSAAVGEQDGSFVTIDGGMIPIAASVRTIRMDGLTSKGSEYALPAAELSKTAIIPAVKSGISTKLELYSEEDAKASVHWVSSSGMTDVKTVILEGGKVKIEDLGTVPDNAEAICITSTEKMTAQAIQEKNDERNDDFALIPAVNAGKTWSAAIPDETSAFMKIVNARANSKISVKINGYNSNGEQTDEKTVILEGGFAFGFRPEDIGRDCVAFIAEAENVSDKTAQNSGSSKAQQSEPKITLSAILEPESSDFSGISFLSGSSANSSLTELHAKRSLTVFN